MLPPARWREAAGRLMLRLKLLWETGERRETPRRARAAALPTTAATLDDRVEHSPPILS